MMQPGIGEQGEQERELPYIENGNDMTKKELMGQVSERMKQYGTRTVTFCFPDMYGRLMGKRFDANFFLNEAMEGGTHCCDYLLATNMQMDPVSGYNFANWEKGYGDFHLVPDLSTFKILPWAQGNAIVLGDCFNNTTHKRIEVAPRGLLQTQLDKFHKSGFEINAATELEFYTFLTPYREARDKDYTKKDMESVSDVIEDYHIFQTGREETLIGHARHYMTKLGLEVETSKGEAGVGQHELNISYDKPIQTCDNHQLYKYILKETADANRQSVTFMAKPYDDDTGSGCHIHLSLHDENGKNLFAGDEEIVEGVHGSKLFKQFLAGWMKYTPEVMPFYAPNINSYKRFQSASWAPTKLAWCYDNRTAGFRIVGKGQSLRIECRIAGADVNPYLAIAAGMASGYAGIQEKLTPPKMFEGDIYSAQKLPEVPLTLDEAVDNFKNSKFAEKAFGKEVVEHYTRFFENEVEEYGKAVTNWERARYYEQI